ncbi:uncharacterized protein LOC114355343 [Ostrinia furnacalis]|uniref:uncharacterized protein LOC114355343 n=1 Tax=Ostrinia furnacalis TaxID=93504 RepID=UPI00103C699C|nr:uncharacterized protein LOC114355343 [Ostrinia furnacalis]
MFTISPYAFHPLLQRFVALWRYVQVVSDCLTFLLSMLCCQCWTLMPLSPTTSEKASVESFQILPEARIEPGRASGEPFRAQHLVIDFSPQPGDTEETGAKCQQFWEAVNAHPDLDGMMVLPENKTQAVINSSVPVHKPSSPSAHQPNFQALHSIKDMGDTGVFNAAFATTTSKHN